MTVIVVAQLIFVKFQCSRDDISTKLNKVIEDVPAVHIGNPKTLEFQVSSFRSCYA